MLRIATPRLAIPLVFGVVSLPEITHSVIRSISIYMVNLVCRPSAVINGPCYTVSSEKRIKNGANFVALLIGGCERLFPSVFRIPCAVRLFIFKHLSRSWLPVKLSGLRVVLQKLAQLLRSW